MDLGLTSPDLETRGGDGGRVPRLLRGAPTSFALLATRWKFARVDSRLFARVCSGAWHRSHSTSSRPADNRLVILLSKILFLWELNGFLKWTFRRIAQCTVQEVDLFYLGDPGPNGGRVLLGLDWKHIISGDVSMKKPLFYDCINLRQPNVLSLFFSPFSWILNQVWRGFYSLVVVLCWRKTTCTIAAKTKHKLGRSEFLDTKSHQEKKKVSVKKGAGMLNQGAT